MSIRGTSDETIEDEKPNSPALAVPSRTQAPSVSRMAASARHER